MRTDPDRLNSSPGGVQPVLYQHEPLGRGLRDAAAAFSRKFAFRSAERVFETDQRLTLLVGGPDRFLKHWERPSRRQECFAARGQARRTAASTNDAERVADRRRRRISRNAAAIRILADLDEAEMSMLSLSQAPRGPLRLELPVSFGRLHVLPIVNGFMSKWPQVSVNVSFSDRFVDLIDEGVDLAVRLGGSDDSRLMTRFLAPHRLVMCASPIYLKKHVTPQTIEQLANHSCLAFVHGGRPCDWRFNVDELIRTVAVNGRFSSMNAVGRARHHSRRPRHCKASYLFDQRSSSRWTAGADSQPVFHRRSRRPRGVSIQSATFRQKSVLLSTSF